jgi:hypothetical protein
MGQDSSILHVNIVRFEGHRIQTEIHRISSASPLVLNRTVHEGEAIPIAA